MVKQLLVLLLVVISMYLSGGVSGLGLFFHVEAMLLVFGGTFLLAWAAYPVKEMSGQACLQYAGRCAVWLGVLTTMLDLMNHFLAVSGDPDLIRRFAPSLMGVFYGVLLSKVILAPMAERARAKTLNS